jgi:hypothetical protein
VKEATCSVITFLIWASRSLEKSKARQNCQHGRRERRPRKKTREGNELGHLSLGDLSEQGLLLGLEVLLEVSVPLDNVLNGDGVEETVDTGVDLMRRTKRATIDSARLLA